MSQVTAAQAVAALWVGIKDGVPRLLRAILVMPKEPVPRAVWIFTVGHLIIWALWVGPWLDQNREFGKTKTDYQRIINSDEAAKRGLDLGG